MTKKLPIPPNLSDLSHAEKDALIASLLERLSVLEGMLRKDSSNSSKPPSSDGLQRKPKSLRQKGNAKVGGQPGHAGVTLRQSDRIDHTIIHPHPLACDVCGASLATQAATLANETRQVIDLPPIRFEVTEHRVLQVRCQCGTHHCGAFPEDVISAVQYGARVKASTTYFTQYQQLPVKRCAEAMRDLFGIALCAGTVVNHVLHAAKKLTPTVATIAEAIVTAPVVHFDETGMRVGKTLTWLHTASTATLTWYGQHAKRGTVAMNDMNILPRYQGVAVHDGLPSYRQYPCTHALCNAHHLRELLFVFETTGQKWAQDMMHLLCAAKDEMAALRGTDCALSEQRRCAIKKRYYVLIRRGRKDNPERRRSRDNPAENGRVKQSPATNLLRRLVDHADDVLRFTSDPSVPFDNNQAERDIRMPKLKQKVSGCFRSTEGVAAFCTIRSFLSTLRKRGQDLFHALVMTFSGSAPAAV